MQFETKRLILRPWQLSDAESCYHYAKDPKVGPVAGWPAHLSVQDSEKVIANVLGVPETYAVCLKGKNEAIGSIGLMIGDKSNIDITPNEAELGYWIGVPFWGKGLIPEAVFCIMEYAFDTLHLDKLWCGYFDGNVRSQRVMKKCGFQYKFTLENKAWPLMKDIRTEHITCITRQEWEMM